MLTHLAAWIKEPRLPPQWQSLVPVVPMHAVMVLNKVCLTIFNKSPCIFFFIFLSLTCQTPNIAATKIISRPEFQNGGGCLSPCAPTTAWGPLPNHPAIPYILWQDSPDLSAQVQHRPHLSLEQCLSSKENYSQQNYWVGNQHFKK